MFIEFDHTYTHWVLIQVLKITLLTYDLDLIMTMIFMVVKIIFYLYCLYLTFSCTKFDYTHTRKSLRERFLYSVFTSDLEPHMT